MLTEPQRQHVASATRTLQFLVGGIFAGAAGFLGIVLLLRDAVPSDEWMMSYLALFVAVTNVLLALILPSFISSQHLRSGTHELSQADAAPESSDQLAPLLALYQTRLIITAALLEGAAFFCLVAYLLEGHRMTLVAAAALLVLILLQFPLPGRVESWLTHEIESREQLRHLS